MDKEKHNSQLQPLINRTYKDTLFRMIFREKDHLLQLYNALNHTEYTEENELEVVTLENAIYMNMKNDVAFILIDYLNIYEHQSTYNPNMPLRDLFYICREYEKLIEQEALYHSTKIQIPNPRFVVFYNGVEKQEECQILKLSDLYLRKEDNPELELKVRMLNINIGYNQTIMEQCRILSEYMQYVDTVRKYAAIMPTPVAVDQAVTECIKNGILAVFLQKYRQEAIQMSIFEYDEEKALRLIRQDEHQLGLEEGIAQGIAQGQQQGRKQGLEEGIRSLVEVCQEVGRSLVDTVETVVSKFGLDEAESRAKVEKYWK